MVKRIIIFLRHGKTGKAEIDLDRQLTEEGIQQAITRRAAMGQPMFDLVLASSADRAKSTAAVIAGIDVHRVVGLDALYLPTDPADKNAVDEMFSQLAYSPLRAYREADITGALMRYGANGTAAILELIEDADAKDILITGHAVLLNAVVSHMIDGDTDLILDANLGEVEGLRVTISEDGSTSVELVQ